MRKVVPSQLVPVPRSLRQTVRETLSAIGLREIGRLRAVGLAVLVGAGSVAGLSRAHPRRFERKRRSGENRASSSRIEDARDAAGEIHAPEVIEAAAEAVLDGADRAPDPGVGGKPDGDRA